MVGSLPLCFELLKYLMPHTLIRVREGLRAGEVVGEGRQDRHMPRSRIAGKSDFIVKALCLQTRDDWVVRRPNVKKRCGFVASRRGPIQWAPRGFDPQLRGRIKERRNRLWS